MESERTMITPTVGRVVWFYSVNHKPGDQPNVAHVCFVHGVRCVNLAVFTHLGLPYPAEEVLLVQEDDPEPPPYTPHARWMPYQLGQAKKASP